MASTPKNYEPMTFKEAEAYLASKVDEDIVTAAIAEEEGTLAVLIYAETLRVHERIDEIENQAQEMMSPDAMMKMATTFLGGGLAP